MKILIYGLNYSPELTGIGKYTGVMAKSLAQAGHNVHVITSPPYYPEWKIHPGYSAWRYRKELKDNITVYRVPTFVPKKPNTVKRLQHLISFSLSSIPIAFGHLWWKPDIVLAVQPTLFASSGALLLAKFTRAKSVLHIQDYELDAMLGLGMMKESFWVRSARSLERWIMMQFDAVSTISYSMLERARLKGVPESKLLFFPNWADTDFVTPEVDGSVLKAEWGFSEGDRVILYAGNIGVKQGLELVLDAAESLRDNTSCHFVIVGAGAHSERLKADALARGLQNVHFKPLQPWGRVPQMLSMADVHLVIQRRGAADVVLPSKVTNILSAGGHAVITAEAHTELGQLAERFPGIYTRIETEDPDLLVGALTSLLADDLGQPNLIARNYALEFLSQDKILTRFENDLINLVGTGKISP